MIKRFRFISFCRSRKDTEVVTKECKDRLNRNKTRYNLSDKIAGYRGGYTPSERRRIEKEIKDAKEKELSDISYDKFSNAKDSMIDTFNIIAGVKK